MGLAVWGAAVQRFLGGSRFWGETKGVPDFNLHFLQGRLAGALMGTRSKRRSPSKGKRRKSPPQTFAGESVEAWFQEMSHTKSPLLLGLARLLGDAAEACLDLRRKHRDEFFRKKIGSVERDLWLSFYRNPSQVVWRLLRVFFPMKIQRHRLSTWIVIHAVVWQLPAEFWIKLMETLTPEEIRELNEAIHMALKDFREKHWPQVQSLMQRMAEGDDSDFGPQGVQPQDLFRVPEILFAFQVLLPSLLEYGRNPFSLFEAARGGDWEAVEKLLRLDKRILSDPEIVSRIDALAQQHSELREEIAQAYQGVPSGALRMKTIKYGLAGFLRVASKKLHQPFTHRELRRLLDAYARRKGKECDEDVPCSDEAFKQAVQRAAQDVKWEDWNIFSCFQCPPEFFSESLSSGHHEPEPPQIDAA